LLVDLLAADDLAGNRLEAIFETVGDHDNAVTAGALCRLDDEVVMAFDDALEVVDFLFRGNDPVQLGHMDAGGDGTFLGEDLVIDDGVQVPFVVLQHVIRIAPVDTHDALGFQGLPAFDQTEHGINP